MSARRSRAGGRWVKTLVVLFLLVSAAAYLYLAPWYLAPFRRARTEETANKDLAAELSHLKRDTEAMEKRTREPKDRWEAERRLREKGYVKPGELLLRGPEIGATDP